MSKRVLLRVLPLALIVILLAGLVPLWSLHQSPTINNLFSNIGTDPGV